MRFVSADLKGCSRDWGFLWISFISTLILAPAEDIEELQNEIEIEIKEPIKKEPTRWVAFAPTSYHQG